MKVTVIGFGAVGASVVALLNNSFRDGIINIQDPNPYVHGKYLDLAHAASAQCNLLTLNNKEVFESSDCIIYAAGMRNAKGASRASVVKQNKSLVKNIFREVDLINAPLIINLVNPVEAISLWIHEKIQGKGFVVSTGTGLDTARLQFLLCDFYKVPFSKIQTLVMGEHGTEMVPIFSQTKLDKKIADKILSDTEKENLKETLLNAAKSIRTTEKATKYGVAQIAVNVFQHYFFDTGTLRIPLSIHSDLISDFIPFDHQIFFNVNTEIRQKNIQYLPIQVNDIEYNHLLKARESIEHTLKG